MNTYRVCKDPINPYVMINKLLINNPGLSLKAKGLMAYLLSKPDKWQVREKDLVKSSTDGKASIRTALRELQSKGYITKSQARTTKGTYRPVVYDIFEYPQTNQVKSITSSVDRKPVSGRLSNNDSISEIEAPLPASIYDIEQARNHAFSNADLEAIKRDMQRIR
uniref:Uncharacterized protein n=1 Tax=viral metagenome TaxID=1070528 RepID=A0A6M3JR59_9ZZZZ